MDKAELEEAGPFDVSCDASSTRNPSVSRRRRHRERAHARILLPRLPQQERRQARVPAAAPGDHRGRLGRRRERQGGQGRAARPLVAVRLPSTLLPALGHASASSQLKQLCAQDALLEHFQLPVEHVWQHLVGYVSCAADNTSIHAGYYVALVERLRAAGGGRVPHAPHMLCLWHSVMVCLQLLRLQAGGHGSPSLRLRCA